MVETPIWNKHYSDVIKRSSKGAGGFKFARLKSVASFSGLASRLVCVVVWLCLVSYAHSQPRLTSSVSSRTGQVSDTFLFTVTFEGSDQQVVPQLSAGGDFQVSYLGPKTVIEMNNGKIRTQLSFIYSLTPTRSGTLRTPEVQVEMNGALLTANPIEITITDTTIGGLDEAPTSNTFLKHTGQPNSVFVGQQILNTLSLYTRNNLRRIKLDDSALEGFWQEKISGSNNHERTLGGLRYSVIDVSRSLYPLKPGVLTIPERSISCDVVESRRPSLSSMLDPFSDNFFQDFFGSSRVTHRTLRAEPIQVNVKPLAEQPAALRKYAPVVPIVGQTKMKIEYSGVPLKAGESKEISITITSSGNLKPLKSLLFESNSDFKVYPGDISETQNLVAGELIMKKKFHYTVVPLKSGLLRVPSPKLSHFNTLTEQYELLSGEDIALVVTANSAFNQSNSQVSKSKEALPNTITTIPTLPPIATAPELSYQPDSLATKINGVLNPRLVLAVFGLLAIIGGGIFVSVTKWIKATDKRRMIKNLHHSATLDEVQGHFFDWLKEILKVDPARCTYNDLRAYAKDRLAENRILPEIVLVLDKLESIKYEQQTQSTSLNELSSMVISIVKDYK